MTLWTPPRRSQLPLGRVWRALARHNVGVDLYLTCGQWHLQVDRLVKRGNEWFREPVGKVTASSDVDAVLDALPLLPGVGVRLAVLAMLMEIYDV